MQPDEPAEKVLTIHCDGAWCHAGAGAAVVITSPIGVKHRYVARLSVALESDRCTNNVAEYEAVILGLRKLRALGVTTCIIKTDSKEGVQILREVHSGTCGSHARPRALAAKVIRQGFYWPAIICATNRVTRSCEACQKFSPRSGNPSQFTKLIAHMWPLQCWGLDIVGPLPMTQGNIKFTIVAVEYFTNWIEARAVSTITSKTA
jgi:ribonuclease HI